MPDTLVYPTTSPTTTITFDTIAKISRTRGITKTFEQGDSDGNGVVESAGVSLLKLKITFEFITDDTLTAIEKLDLFDTLVQTQNENSFRYTTTYETALGNKTQYYDGKVVGLTSDDETGDPDKISGTFSFTVETKGAIS